MGVPWVASRASRASRVCVGSACRVAAVARSKREIAYNYLSSWFALDVMSVLVSGLDVVALFDAGGGTETTTDAQGRVTTTSAASNVSKLKVLRVLRVFRLIKLARLFRASRIAKRWETRVAIN